MITLEDVVTPFDELDSPATVATPTCCCCCCCCLASIATASVVAGRLVRRDLSENAPATHRLTRRVLRTIAVLTPILGLLVFRAFGNEEVEAGLIVAGALTGLLVGCLRKAAGATEAQCVATVLLFAVVYPLAALGEFFAVGATEGQFWLSIPLWIVAAVKLTGKRVPGTSGRLGAVSEEP